MKEAVSRQREERCVVDVIVDLDVARRRCAGQEIPVTDLMAPHHGDGEEAVSGSSAELPATSPSPYNVEVNAHVNGQPSSTRPSPRKRIL